MQQLDRTYIYFTLPDEIKILCENCHQLRLAIIEFVKNIDMGSQYFTPIDEGRTQNALMQLDNPLLQIWKEKLEYLTQDGKWFDDQFIKLSAFFLERDIVIHARTGDIKYCGSPYLTEGDTRDQNQCTCTGLPLHTANIGNYHFQSIIPINGNSMMHRCKKCTYSTNKTSNLTRHETKVHREK